MDNIIKYLVMDVDGTLTDGKINIGSTGELFKSFNVKDGYAIKELLPKAGIQSVFLTGRCSEIVACRAKEIGVDYVFQGVSDKKEVLLHFQNELNITQKEIAYFGDDLNDISSMQLSAIVGCPADACQCVKEIADYVCTNNAGNGALREFVEWLLSPSLSNENLQNRIDDAVKFIRSLDTSKLEPGKYVVNDHFYYLVNQYETKSVDNCVLESHRDYVDIQYLVSGEEIMNIVDTSKLSILKEYNEDEDFLLWSPYKKMMKLYLCAGSSVILFPENAHMGGVAIDEPMFVKKIVGKVSIR